MNVETIKTKKAMLELAETNSIELSSSTLKDMKQEYLLKMLSTEIVKQTQDTAQVIEGDDSTVTIKKGRDTVAVLSYDALSSYVPTLGLRFEDVLNVIDKYWLNVGGYTFSTGSTK